MRVFLVAAAVSISSVVLSGCTETSGGQANAERRSTSIRMCTAAVGKRANTTVVSLVRTQSFERYTACLLYTSPSPRDL